MDVYLQTSGEFNAWNFTQAGLEAYLHCGMALTQENTENKVQPTCGNGTMGIAANEHWTIWGY